jgi:hypothetical protein
MRWDGARAEQSRNCLSYIHVVSNGHALAGREAAHEQDGFFDMPIAVTVNERQAKDARIDALCPKKHFLCREFTERICIDWIASIVLASEARFGNCGTPPPRNVWKNSLPPQGMHALRSSH